MSKIPYQRPSIIKHHSGIANKFGSPSCRRTLSKIDDVSVRELIVRYGTPLFVFSEYRLRRKYREVYDAFASRYPKVQMAWSYKTNYLDAICTIFHQEGAWAEVVSEMEYEMARRLGVPAQRILFNGPYKPKEALSRALLEGARVHIDNYDELYLVEEIAKENDRLFPVTLRVNMDTGIYPRWDRFGFNLDNGEALNAARRILAGDRLSLAGVHCHIGTFILDPKAYRRAAEKIAELVLRIKMEGAPAFEYIDLGGGFPSCNTLHEQYAPGVDSVAPIADYAEEISRALLRLNLPVADLPLLVLEAGRSLVDDAGYMLTQVVANKRLANGTRAVIIDAGINVLFTSLWYRHEVMPVIDRGGMLEEAVVYGPLCMNIDVVRPRALLPPLEVGDQLAIHPVGAYNVTQWMQFIRLRPPVAIIGQNSEIEIIRQAESLDQVKAPERMPTWLTAVNSDQRRSDESAQRQKKQGLRIIGKK